MGVDAKVIKPEEETKESLIELITKLNNDADVHGIIVQLPLPKHLHDHTSSIVALVAKAKDVDGFNLENYD